MNLRSLKQCVFLISVFFIGCSENGNHQYFPLRDGGAGEYAVEAITPMGVINGKIISRSDGKKTINGNEYLKVVSVASGLAMAEQIVEYYRAAPDGIYRIEEKYIDQPESMALPALAEVGSSWTVQLPHTSTESTVEAIEDAVLPDRIYRNCLKVKHEGSYEGKRTEGITYYAPSVGMVKSSVTTGGVTVTLSLLSDS